jgi:hypothetical protein
MAGFARDAEAGRRAASRSERYLTGGVWDVFEPTIKSLYVRE